MLPITFAHCGWHSFGPWSLPPEALLGLMPCLVRLLLIGFAAAVAPAALTAAAALLAARLAACLSRPSSALPPEDKLRMLLTCLGKMHALSLQWRLSQESTLKDVNRSKDIAQKS